MGLGQTLLTIMALMLLGRVILMMNSSTLDAGFTKDMAEYRISATSLGTSMLEQANSLAFDEATVDADITPALISSLTAASSFGPESGETGIKDFDDIDDYDDFEKVETLLNGVIYKTLVDVRYISGTSSTISITTSKTFHKLITVEVTSDFLVDYSITPPRPDTLRFQSIFSYWYFR